MEEVGQKLEEVGQKLEAGSDDEVYVLAMGQCLIEILEDYGVDHSGITPRIADHMVEDFVDLMVLQGYVTKSDKEETHE